MGNETKLVMIIVSTVILGGIAFLTMRSGSNIESAAPSAGKGNYARVFQSPDAALRDSVNANPTQAAIPQQGADAWPSPTKNRPIVVVNGNRGIYDARGNFFPIVGDNN